MRRPLPPSDGIDQEIAAERREKLRELLDSDAWRVVLKPALLARMQRIGRSLATTTDGVEDIRKEQGRYKELHWLVGLTPDQIHQLYEGDG